MLGQLTDENFRKMYAASEIQIRKGKIVVLFMVDQLNGLK